MKAYISTSISEGESDHQMSEFAKKELREAFDSADKNKDGLLSSKEMEDFLKERGVKVSKTTSLKNRIMPRSKMTFEQFCRKIYRSHNSAEATSCEMKMNQYREIFKFLDENGDGLITKSEIHQRMKLCGQNLSDEQVEDMIRLGDKNNDKQIDFNEFVELIKFIGQRNLSSPEGSDNDSFFKPCDHEDSHHSD
ncbi:hypothetical protein GJ496_005817 [Pomphorhynchus laevis]|nr:hypothetical protein GJ496_005817 [Pomphorhynchus laevis]